MIYVPLNKIKEDMILAKDIEISSATGFGIPLIRSGVTLSAQRISQLEKYGVSGVYIKQEGTEDIVPVDVIDSKLKFAALTEIKSVFDAVATKNKELSENLVDGITHISEQLIDNLLNNKEMLVSLNDIKSHDDYTFVHSLCVSILSIAMGIELGYNNSRLRELSTAALLHDLGKIKVPIEIINKPSKLTYEEFEIMKQHPKSGRDIMEDRHHLVSHAVLAGIRSHHEKYDGTGYPKGLSQGAIHPYARIIAIADVYDALTSKRPYRDAMPVFEVVEYITSCVHSHFDFDIVACFSRKIAVYPVGTKVKLSTGINAIVVRNNPGNILRPVVRVVDDDNEPKHDIDLANDITCYNITIVN